MRVLGVDPSTHTGIALVESGKKVIFTEEIEHRKLTGFPRLEALVNDVASIITTYQPDHIFIEDMFVGHASSAVTIIQIGSLLRYYLWQEGITYTDVAPTVLKKFVGGKGNAKKEEIMMHVQKNWGFTSPTNNIADAVGLAMFGLCAHGEPFPVAMKTICQAAMLPKVPKTRKK